MAGIGSTWKPQQASGGSLSPRGGRLPGIPTAVQELRQGASPPDEYDSDNRGEAQNAQSFAPTVHELRRSSSAALLRLHELDGPAHNFAAVHPSPAAIAHTFHDVKYSKSLQNRGMSRPDEGLSLVRLGGIGGFQRLEMQNASGTVANVGKRALPPQKHEGESRKSIKVLSFTVSLAPRRAALWRKRDFGVPHADAGSGRGAGAQTCLERYENALPGCGAKAHLRGQLWDRLQ